MVEKLAEEGIITSRSAVCLFLSRYRKTGSLNDSSRCGKKAILEEEDMAFVEDKMKENDELTAEGLKKKLEEERGVVCHSQQYEVMFYNKDIYIIPSCA